VIKCYTAINRIEIGNNVFTGKKITITDNSHGKSTFEMLSFPPAIRQLYSEGPVVAGQMGMTLAALNGILSLSLAWITTKVPLFSGLIAQENYSKLDYIFNKTLKQSSLINLGGITSGYCLLTIAGLPWAYYIFRTKKTEWHT